VPTVFAGHQVAGEDLNYPINKSLVGWWIALEKPDDTSPLKEGKTIAKALYTILCTTGCATAC
jgi:hypothetical protein